MMREFSTSQSCFQLLYKVGTVTLTCLWLIGCSGGISGTGDGGPIVVIEPPSSGDSASGAPQSPEDTLSIIPTVYDHLIFPPQLITQFSTSLLGVSALNGIIPELPEISVSQKISDQLTAITQQTIQVQLDLAYIEDHLLDTLEQCDFADTCDAVPSDITTTLSTDTLAFQQSLQPQTVSAVGIQNMYSNILFSSEIAGYFDQKLEYSNQSGTSVIVQWTTDNQLVSLVTQSNDFVTYLLTDFRQATTTLRTTDKTAATIFHAVLNGTAATGTTIEADWHGSEQQHYVRAAADEASILLFAIHPTDSSAIPTREAFNLITGNYAVESCTTNNDLCENWQTVVSDNSAIEVRLVETESTLGDFSLSLSSELQVTVPTQVNEFVIARGNGTEQPDALSLVCGGQRVRDNIRSFCWQPLPLANTVNFYEEVSGNSSPVYQQLPEAQIR